MSRMRTGRRDLISACGMALLATLAGAAPPEPRSAPAGSSIEMTLEVDWAAPPRLDGHPAPSPAATAELSLGSGRIIEAVAWPGPDPGVRPRPDGTWSIGSGPRGRARVRVEAPIGADLSVRVAGQSVRVPLASVLEGPQRTGPLSPVEVGVERVPWDAIRAEVGDTGFDGSAEPGAPIPLAVAFHVLTPEPDEVNLRCSAELRPAGGGEPTWRQDWQEVVATNVAAPAKRALILPAAGPEGTYVLEIKASWEPVAGPAGSRPGRWLRRRRVPTQTTTASRRLTLAVVAARPIAMASPPSKADIGPGVDVDAIDLTRALGHRPSAAGRAPADGPGRWSWGVPDSALVEANLRDRLRGWINRVGVEPSTLGPADGSGLAWSAVGLRVPHPERPHRLTLTIAGGHPAALGVALVAGGGPGGRGRVVLDACASGSPVLDGGSPVTFSWPVWPDAETPVLVLVNRSPSTPVQVGSITLTELVDLPPAPARAGADRSLGLHLATPRALDRFGGGDDATGHFDPLAQARNLATYLAHLGASTAVLPDGLADRARRRALGGQAVEDSSGPDRLDLLLRVLGRRGMSAWVDVAFDGPLPGLPAPDSAEAAARGLVRVDRRGGGDGANYQPIHPEVRRAMARKVAEAVAARKGRANLAGALIRLGPGSTLPGGPDSGLDDATYARFLAATFEPGPGSRPGQGTDDPGRFEARARFIEASGRLPWLRWRSREVAATYAALAEAARRSAPGSALAVVTPGLEPGPAGDEARRVDLAGLGPGQAWRGVGLDLDAWPAGDGAPIVFRGAGLSADDLGHDLATSPELDEQVAARPGRGALLGVDAPEPSAGPGRSPGIRLAAAPMAEGAAGDEPLGHALAALDPRRVVLASSSVAGHEERVRRFARVFAALPAPATGPTEPRPPSGAVARAIRSGSDTVLALANDTPYPILLEAVLQAPATAQVDDLGRGIRLDPEKVTGTTRLVIELTPFGVAAIRVGSPEVRVASATPHPGPAVLDGMRAHYEDLSTSLARLNQLLAGDPPPTPAAPRPGPVNPGFEPDAVQLVASRPGPGVAGWEVAGEPGGAVEVDRDRPHSGRASLRLDAKAGPAAVTSLPFRPEGRSTLVVRAWVRADRPDARARVRVDGLAAGRPYSRWFDVPARLDWSEVQVRAAQLPDEGLDSARLRFEPIGPGRVWVDDVAVAGDALSESERLNARRDLMAALSAYRDKRYADFARLAGSHWARHVGPGPAAAAVAGDRSGVIRTGDASALPPARRLR